MGAVVLLWWRCVKSQACFLAPHYCHQSNEFNGMLYIAHATLKYAALRYRKETSVRLHQSTIASADRPRAAAGGTSATCDRLRRAFPSSHDVQWLASGRPLAGTYFSSVFLLVDDAVINMVVVFCFGYDATVGWSSCSSPKNEATKFTWVLSPTAEAV